ncbi:hypothetical protein ACWCXX_08800 [Streptomyces sp. NPDC001732]
MSGVPVVGQQGGSRRPGDPAGGSGGAGAGAGAGHGAGGDVLKHSAGAWLRAAGGAEGMSTHLGLVKAELETAHEGLLAGAGAGAGAGTGAGTGAGAGAGTGTRAGAGGGGLAALAELGAVRDSWTRRFEAARAECEDLAGKLRAVARIQGETDETVRSAFASVVSAGRDGAR